MARPILFLAFTPYTLHFFFAVSCICAIFFVILRAEFVFKQKVENYEQDLHPHHKRFVLI